MPKLSSSDINLHLCEILCEKMHEKVLQRGLKTRRLVSFLHYSGVAEIDAFPGVVGGLLDRLEEGPDARAGGALARVHGPRA